MLKFSTQKLVYCAVFLAIAVLLSFFSIYLSEAIKITFAPLIIIFAGAVLGPIPGAIIGAATDLLVLLLKSLPGAYFPGFTVTMALYGLLAGFLFFRRNFQFSVLKTVLGVLLIQFVCSLLINTGWLSLLMGTPYFVLMVTRIPTTAISYAFYVVILLVLLKNKEKIVRYR